MIRRLATGAMALLWAASLHAQEIRGSVKDLAGVTVNNELGSPVWLNLLQGRIESGWDVAPSIRIQADGRALLRTVDDRHATDFRLERAHVSFRRGAWEAALGRQRINWGKSMVWNPNDVFNAYAFLDIDEEVRPSTDAVWVQRAWGVNSSVDAGVSRDAAAVMLRGGVGSYDLQVLAARYKNQWVLGSGWSGYVGSSGFKGEASWFSGDGTVSASAGMDHMLPNGLYLNAEVLRNGGFKTSAFTGPLGASPSPENLFPAPSAYMFGAGSAVHPLFSLNLAVVGALTRDLTIFVPQASVSLTEDLDLLVMGQVLRSYDMNSVFVRVRWAF